MTCRVCKGSGKLQDPVHDWVIVTCYACEGTGEETEFFKKVHGSYQKVIDK